MTHLKREKEKKQRALKEREVDIDAGFLYGMQPSVPHIVLPQRQASSKSFLLLVSLHLQMIFYSIEKN